MYKIHYKFYTNLDGERIRTDELFTTIEQNNQANARDTFDYIMRLEHSNKNGLMYSWEMISLERMFDV